MTTLPRTSFGLLPPDSRYSLASYKNWGVWDKRTNSMISLPSLISKRKGTRDEVPYERVNTGKGPKGGIVTYYTPKDIKEAVAGPFAVMPKPPERQAVSYAPRPALVDAPTEAEKEQLAAQIFNLEEVREKLLQDIARQRRLLKVEKKLPFALPDIQHGAIDLDKMVYGGVYFLLLKQKLVYVGVTHNFGTRIITHKNDPKKSFDQVFLLPEGDREAMLRIEGRYIKAYRPIFNKAGKPKEEEEV
jgi:hypothetical protein